MLIQENWAGGGGGGFSLETVSKHNYPERRGGRLHYPPSITTSSKGGGGGSGDKRVEVSVQTEDGDGDGG